MSNIFVSIIIPIYNTGEYLYKCLDSIIGQELNEIEIILVNDGSTDNSGEICDFYAEKDKRVHVIHKENAGVSVARNTGIKVANGNYIGFIDSDDWIEKNMYQDLYRCVRETGAEIAMCDATTVYGSDKKEEDTISFLTESIFLDKEDIQAFALKEIAGSACRCIYKRELLEKYGVEFPEGVPLSEDRIFNLNAIGNSSGFYYIKKAYYNRYVRKESAVSKYYPNLLQITKQYRRAVLDVIERLWAIDKSYRQIYNQQFLETYLSNVYNLYNINCPLRMKEKKAKLKELVNDRGLIDTLGECDMLNWKSKLLKSKRVSLLLILGKLYQLKQQKRERERNVQS